MVFISFYVLSMLHLEIDQSDDTTLAFFLNMIWFHFYVISDHDSLDFVNNVALFVPAEQMTDPWK